MDCLDYSLPTIKIPGAVAAECGPHPLLGRDSGQPRPNADRALHAYDAIATAGPTCRVNLSPVANMFLLPGAEKALSIPSAVRDRILDSLRHSSHPTNLEPVADHVFGLLRECSHRNFVRCAASNTTVETQRMMVSLGVAIVIGGIFLFSLRPLAPFTGANSRYYNSLVYWPAWFVGSCLISSGLSGSCVLLVPFASRQPLAWERSNDTANTSTGHPGRTSAVLRAVSRLAICDRRIRVEDVHLMRLHRRMALQSVIASAALASALCLVMLLVTR